MNIIENLSRDAIVNELREMKNGTFYKIVYAHEVPVKAEYKKKGFRIFKVTETVTRSGVNYGNIKKVKERIAADNTKKDTTSNWSWVVKNWIQYNSNTGCEYLVTAPIKEMYTKNKYVVVDDCANINTVTEEILNKDLIVPSYFNSSEYSGLIKKINLANIISINSCGRKMF